jgi:serine protease AprX
VTRRQVRLLILSFLTVASVGLSAGQYPAARDNLSPSLLDYLSQKSSDATIPVWVLFKDRGLGPRELDDALQQVRGTLPERALVRRLKAIPDSEAIGEWDLPVADDYLDSISARCKMIRTTSRWLNGVSVDATADQIGDISTLPFVARIQLVAQGKVGMAPYQDGESWSWGEHPLSGALGGGDYGSSYQQAAQIHAVEAHRAGYTGRSVLVAMLDTGFQLSHEAFEHLSVVDQYDFIHKDGDTSYDPSQDLRGQPMHGTATMSVIGGYMPGELIGLAHDADFLLAKTEDTSSETPVEEDYWVEALEWAERYGADIVSSSLGYQNWYVKGDYNGLVSPASRAANFAYELGVIICNSMGNEGPMPTTIGAPADAEGALAIGAVDSTGTIARFSSRGPTADDRIKPDLSARGVHTTCAMAYTENRYGKWNGTSLACPVAAGGIALVIEAHPNWPPYRIVEAVKETATRADRPDNTYGWGILNVWAAIQYPSLSGWILDDDTGIGIPNARLTVESSDTSVIFETDSTGYFDLTNLPFDNYRLAAAAIGYSPSEPQIVFIPPDIDIDFVLKKIR